MRANIDSRPDRFWKLLALAILLYFALLLFGCESNDEQEYSCEQHNEFINALADEQYKGFDKVDPELFSRVEKWRVKHLNDCE